MQSCSFGLSSLPKRYLCKRKTSHLLYPRGVQPNGLVPRTGFEPLNVYFVSVDI